MAQIDETVLVAYVDGKLNNDAELRAVESALRTDAELRETVRKLRLTPGPLHAAFDTSLHQPPEPELAQYILDYELAAAAARERQLPLRLVAVLCVIVLFAGLGLGYFQWGQLHNWSAQTSVEPWLRAVAEYQVLYGRDTLHQTDADTSLISATEQRISSRLGTTLHVPELDSFGLAFKRGQMLEFEGRPLAQLAYLPRQGRPLAYCIMPTDVHDKAPTPGSVKGLNYYFWHHNGFGYVVIADMGLEQLRKIANTAYGSLLIGSS